MKFDPALAKSFGLHSVIIALLLVSVNFTADPIAMPVQSVPVIEATFIDAQAIADKKREEERILAEQKRIEDQKRAEQRKAADAKRRAEAKRKAEKAAEDKRLKEQKRQQDLKKKAAQEAKRKRELEEANKRKAEDARKQKELDRLQEEQLEAERREQAARRNQQRNQQISNDVERYRAEINGRIQRHIIDDPAFKGKECRLNIKLASTGLVIKVSTLGGDPALCRVAENAVIREEKLPVSDDPAVYEELKNINLTVKL